MAGTSKLVAMKIILLFFLSLVIEPCVAQDRFPLIQQQVQKPAQTTMFFEPVNANENFVIAHLRAAKRKKPLDNFFHPPATTNKTPVAACCKISKTYFIIDQGWLCYNFNAETSGQKVKMIANIAGELMDTFLGQYSIQNKVNY